MVMPASVLETRVQNLLPGLERVYTDIHAHPELSMQETRTARYRSGPFAPRGIRGDRWHRRDRRRRAAA